MVEMWADLLFVCRMATFVASVWTSFSAAAVCALVVTFSAADSFCMSVAWLSDGGHTVSVTATCGDG